MQARYPDNYEYPNEKPAQYTSKETSTYFTASGITQLGYIRGKLEALSETPNLSKETTSSILKIIAIIDGLTDKSFGSSATVLYRITNLHKNLMAIFPVTDGAISFNNIILLNAAKILTQGIAAIQPDDLNPSKTANNLFSKSENTYTTIKSTMDSICAQINFFIQLYENAIASEALYKLAKNIAAIERKITSIDIDEDTIADQRIRDGDPKMHPIDFFNRVDGVINEANACIDEYANNLCSSITVVTKGIGHSPIAAFQLMLANPCSLTKLTQSDNIAEKSIGEEELLPIFMTTSVPFSLLQLCRTLKGSLNKAGLYLEKNPDVVATARLHSTTDHLQEAINTLETAMVQKAGNPENASLKTNLIQFKENLLAELEGYQTSKKTTNEVKLEICKNLATGINERINFEFEFGPNNQFAKFISLVASHYYQHNDYCATSKKSPGKLGSILVDAMNKLSGFSANICAHDSYYHQTNLDNVNLLLERRLENTPSPRPKH